MKLLMIFAIAMPFSAQAQFSLTPNVDHLARLDGGAKTFCNFMNLLRKLPANATACQAVIQIQKSPENLAAIEAGEFGQVLQLFPVSEDFPYVNLVSYVTVEQLQALRYDVRINALAPNTPMGGTGAFTVRNGEAE